VLQIIDFVRHGHRLGYQVKPSTSGAKVMRLVRLLELLMLLRVDRRVKGFKRVFYVLRDSYAELWMTLFLTMLTLVIFSTAM
jgi:hypothetical protein